MIIWIVIEGELQGEAWVIIVKMMILLRVGNRCFKLNLIIIIIIFSTLPTAHDSFTSSFQTDPYQRTP